MKTAQQSFDEKYIPEPMSGCWLWTNALNLDGYGKFHFELKRSSAHRASWEIHRGPIPNGLQVLHKCDVPCCVNPDHLFLGTPKDNAQDCIKKGRRGKVSREVAEEIRNSTETLAKLAAKFGLREDRALALKEGRRYLRTGG
jgi:hypothetical protein